MWSRTTRLAASAWVAVQIAAGPAAADNKMGYQMVSAEQASAMPRAGGSLGMKIGPEEMIDSEGLHFAVLKVERVQPDSPAAQASLKVGDQIIAVNGRVFPNVAAFAGYVGSIPPGKLIEVDFMPAGGGPKQAQRVGVTVGEAGRAAPPIAPRPSAASRPAASLLFASRIWRTSWKASASPGAFRSRAIRSAVAFPSGAATAAIVPSRP